MEFTLRLGQTQATTQFPLPINGVADWLQLDPGVWQTALTLPDLPPEHIIIPSFAMVGVDFRFQFQISPTNFMVCIAFREHQNQF